MDDPHEVSKIDRFFSALVTSSAARYVDVLHTEGLKSPTLPYNDNNIIIWIIGKGFAVSSSESRK